MIVENLVDLGLRSGVIEVKAVLKRMLQKAQSLLLWIRGLSFFGELLPVLLAAFLSLALVFHISFEIRGIMYGAENTSTVLKKITLVIASDKVRNLSLLLVASIGWYFLYRRTTTAEQNTKAAQQSVVTAEKGLTAERLTRAIDQLASDKPSIRLGGILGLHQIFEANEEERYKIIRILSSFIHDFAPIDSDTRKIEKRSKHSDIEEAIKILATITAPLIADDKRRLFDLHHTNLSGLAFGVVDFSYFRLSGANFSNSFLYAVCFTGAVLDGVNFSGVSCPDPHDLTPEQIKNAFYWRGEPPKEFPEELVENLLEIEKPEEKHE